MKYILSALLLSFLLLIPVGLIAAPLHNANAVQLPALYVAPSEPSFEGPCVAGTEFNISVNLLDMPISGKDIYAFSFTLDWSAVADYVALVSAVVSSPWATGDYFLAENATYAMPGTSGGDGFSGGTGSPGPSIILGYPFGQPGYDGVTDYILAMTATPPGVGLTNVNQAVLTLTFQITTNVNWPFNFLVNNAFKLGESWTSTVPVNVLIPGDQAYFYDFTTGPGTIQMSGDGTQVIPLSPEVDEGSFEIYSVQPSMELVDTDAVLNSTTPSVAYPTPPMGSIGPLGTEMIVEKCISHETDVEVELNNITQAYGFGFTMYFNPLYLQPDVQKITIKSDYPPPYATLDIEYTPPTFTYVYSPVTGAITTYPTVTMANGVITVNVVRPLEKPTVCSSLSAAIDIVFHTVDYVTGPLVPTTSIIGTPTTAPVTQDPEFIGGLIPTPSQSWIYLCNGYVLCKSFDDWQGPGTAANGLLEYSFGESAPVAGITLAGWWNTNTNPFKPWNGAVQDAGTQGLIYGVYTNTNPWGVGSFAAIGDGIEFIDTGLLAAENTAPVNAGSLVYNSILYWFHPSKYDLNLDCTVDIQDLIVLSYVYGIPLVDSTHTPIPGSYGDLYPPDFPVVDIFDMVAIAKHFGPVDP